jgi:hypothetical protein
VKNRRGDGKSEPLRPRDQLARFWTGAAAMKKRHWSAQHVYVPARRSLPSSCVFRRSSDAFLITTTTPGRDSDKGNFLLLRVLKFSTTKYIGARMM